jgi:hypothetical protein
MTPLAHQLARRLLNPRASLPANYRARALRALGGAHFFEVTEAAAIGEEVAAAINEVRGDGNSGEQFIPCTVAAEQIGGRTAASLSGPVDQTAVTAVVRYPDGNISVNEIGALDLPTGVRTVSRELLATYPKNAEWARDTLDRTFVFLAIVNSPRIVHRNARPPHKSLVRELKRAPSVGIGPLLPWHEVKLQVTKPVDIDDGEPHRDQITGRRALHFVCKFIRLRLGRLEYVRAHWRGDPVLGIHQSDYRVSV